VGIGFNANEVASFRQDAAGLLVDTATITPPTVTIDETGAAATTYAATGAYTLACMITESRPSVYAMFGAAIQPGTLYRLRLPYGSSIPDDARIVINSKTYRVAKPDSNVSYNITDGLYVVLQDPA